MKEQTKTNEKRSEVVTNERTESALMNGAYMVIKSYCSFCKMLYIHVYFMLSSGIVECTVAI